MPLKNNFETVWANQWEPPGTEGRQFAFRCYQQRFDPKNEHPETLSNVNISEALDGAETGAITIPDCDMIVGGFPCQDYSVAKTLAQANGITGKKGVLWWEIRRLIKLKEPHYLLLENVDRLLKSPASQRGRDFAIMLSCLHNDGYSVEWRVINAAEYGFPQKRKRVYIFAEKTESKWDLEDRLLRSGVLAEAFPIADEITKTDSFKIVKDIQKTNDCFGINDKVSKFHNAGIMQKGKVFTADCRASYSGEAHTIRTILTPEDDVPSEFYVAGEKLEQWEYLKGSKKISRTSKNGHTYFYSEGSMAFPDSLDKPARTILTGEGGQTPSRFKHIIQCEDGRYRRLTPDELDQLQGFPKGWTNTGMSDGNRAFCMGNALVVGIPQRIGEIIAKKALNSHIQD